MALLHDELCTCGSHLTIKVHVCACVCVKCFGQILVATKFPGSLRRLLLELISDLPTDQFELNLEAKVESKMHKLDSTST